MKRVLVRLSKGAVRKSNCERPHATTENGVNMAKMGANYGVFFNGIVISLNFVVENNLTKKYPLTPQEGAFMW